MTLPLPRESRPLGVRKEAQPGSAHMGSSASKQVKLNQGKECPERKRKLAMNSEKL